jgi:hypothetical protein
MGWNTGDTENTVPQVYNNQLAEFADLFLIEIEFFLVPITTLCKVLFLADPDSYRDQSRRGEGAEVSPLKGF